METQRIDEIRALVSSGETRSALVAVLEVLNSDNGNLEARALLARLYFELGWTTLSVEELQKIHAENSGLKSAARLLSFMGSSAVNSEKAEEIVAETDLDLDIVPAQSSSHTIRR